MKKTIYVLDHRIKWSVFKMLQDKLTKDSGIVMVQGDKAIWRLLRDKKIYCWFSEDMKDDMHIALELPKGKYFLITNPK